MIDQLTASACPSVIQLPTVLPLQLLKKESHIARRGTTRARRLDSLEAEGSIFYNISGVEENNPFLPKECVAGIQDDTLPSYPKPCDQVDPVSLYSIRCGDHRFQSGGAETPLFHPGRCLMQNQFDCPAFVSGGSVTVLKMPGKSGSVIRSRVRRAIATITPPVSAGSNLAAGFDIEHFKMLDRPGFGHDPAGSQEKQESCNGE